jgi:hypothetical protein
LGFNPMTASTPFGEVVGVSVGDVVSRCWELEDMPQNQPHGSGLQESTD